MVNYFSLIGVPQGFDIAPAQMEKRYFELQRQYHPDRAIAGDRQHVLQRSMTINEAYQALKAPLKRAQHLLKLQGVEVNTEKDTYKPAPALLMEIMELREQLSAADASSIVQLQETVEYEKKDCLKALSESFKNERYETAAQLTMRLNYLTKFLDEARIIQQKKYASAANT